MPGKKPKTLPKRTVVLAGMLAVAASLLLIRILILQTVSYGKYQAKVLDEVTTEVPVEAKRGTIYDRNGKILAYNRTAYRLFISPKDIETAQKDRKDKEKTQAEMIAEGIAEILGQEYYEKVLHEATYTNKLDRTILKNIVDDDIYKKLLAFISENDLSAQVHLGVGSIRAYPYGSLACHVIGFCNSDGDGLYGIEYQYNDVLSGTDGKILKMRDAYGSEMEYNYETYVAAVDGCDIYTTIDVDVQRVLDEQCKQSFINTGSRNGVCGIVMDPETGGILAMSTAPAFDLNSPWTLVDFYQKQLDEYATANGLLIGDEKYVDKQAELRQKMWANKAITEAFIPGSTFKMVTSAMALENNVVTDVYATDSRCYCDGSGRLGSTVVGGVRIHCHSKHHAQSFAEGLMNSCNVTFINIGLDIGSRNFYNAFKAFGYLSKTGIDLPGEGTSIMHKYENLKTVELATSAFGQNFKITGIQHITAENAIVNGGKLLQPFVVNRIVDTKGITTYTHGVVAVREVASASTCELLRTILEECVSGGYGGKNCYVPGYRVAAKTGTSEKVGDDKDLRIGSVMAFAPAEKPVATAFFMCDEPDPTCGSTYGSTVAAPYMQELMQQTLPILGVEGRYSDSEKENINRRVPDFVGWSVSAILNNIKDYDIEYEIVGSGNIIRYQNPKGGTYVKDAGSKVILYTDTKLSDDNVKPVPNLVGMTAAAANKTLTNLGFNVVIQGSSYYKNSTTATVKSQSAAPGTILEKGSVIILYFDDDYDNGEYDPIIGGVG